jgi:ribonuclease-3
MPNLKGIAVDADTLERCQRILDYTFTDPSLLKLALTHASVAASRVQSNERLEFLGDSVLGLAVCHALYAGQPDLMEGGMTKIKSSVVSRATCAAIADETGISELLVAGKGVSDRSGLPTSVSAAVFEALIGAIYLDGGPDAATKFVMRCVGPHLEEALGNEHQKN